MLHLLNTAAYPCCRYVDDHRNTDNAWTESIVYHFHCPQFMADGLPIKDYSTSKYAHTPPEDGAMAWLDVPIDEDGSVSTCKLLTWACHFDWVRHAALLLTKKPSILIEGSSEADALQERPKYKHPTKWSDAERAPRSAGAPIAKATSWASSRSIASWANMAARLR